MTTSENRRKALIDAIDEAIRAWAQRFGNKPDFEPDSEICFCTGVVLGSFIARCCDEQRREYLLKEMQTSLNDAVDIARARRAAYDQAARETDDTGEVGRMLAIRTGNRKRDLEANARLETGTRDQARGPTRVAMKNEPVQGSMDDPTWVALQRCPWCLVVPTDCPDDPDIIGPFTSFEEAQIWSRAYPEGFVGTIQSLEFVILCRADEEEDKARRRRRN
jgi:hypothetical protein